MKILHLCPHFHPCLGGIERHVEDLCRNLRKRGHQSDVFCLNTCAYSREKLPASEEYNGIRIFRLPYLNLKIYNIAPSVIKFVKDYDAIHIHGLGFFLDFMILTKFIHKKPLILSTHGGIFHTKKYSIFKKIYFYLWCRLALKNIDSIIAVSKSDEQIFSKISSRVKSIPNPIETDDFTNLDREIEENSLLYVGRISRNKRIDNLIKTVYFIQKKEPDVKLYIVGGDWEGILKGLELLIDEKRLKNNIVIVGEVEDKNRLSEYFSKAKFFVYASEYEGFGISILEAMAAGLTVVVNDINPFRDIVTNGENGFLVDYSKNEEAANVLLDLMERDLEQVSRNAKKTSIGYDWEKAIMRFEKIYEEAR